MNRRFQSLALLLTCTAMLAGAQEPAAQSAPLPDLNGRPKIQKDTRHQLIRVLSSEYAYSRRALPSGVEGLRIEANGQVSPSPGEMQQVIYKVGLGAKPGERVQITDMEFKGDDIVFYINGGPVKKKKWYERIEVSGMGGSTPVTKPDDQVRRGTSIILTFKKHIPEITAQEVKRLLEPVLDFTMKSAAQAYIDTLPPKAREAIANKKVLVGMSREMVTHSKGRPDQRVREKGPEGDEYEEWIFGRPPQVVEFIRFVGDEVVQVKTMTVDGERIVRTEKELDLHAPAAAAEVARKEEPKPATPRAKAPTLRRPDDPPPGVAQDPRRPDGPSPGSTQEPPDAPR